MYDKLVFNTTSEAYLFTLKTLLEYPQYKCAPRGLPIHEITDYSFAVHYPDSNPIVTRDSERNKIIASYTQKEMDLYNSCSNRVEDFTKASKFWEKIANPDGTINSAYGYLIWKNESLGNDFEQVSTLHPAFDDQNSGTVKIRTPVRKTPWAWCVESLKADKDTRQAVLKFSLPEHHYKGVKDFTCTLHANWLIRNDKLNLSVVMRSNDVVKGLTYDISWFCSLMDRMLEDLKETYPDLKKGSYNHFVHSMHAYEKDFAIIKKMLGE